MCVSSAQSLHSLTTTITDVAASFMNTVILTSVLSAGNHALFAGTRVLYGLSVTAPRQAPLTFSKLTPGGVPLAALLATSSVSVLCFGSSFIGSGTVWGWLQNIVGVSNQVCQIVAACPRELILFFSRSRGCRSAWQAGDFDVHGLNKVGHLKR